MCIHTHLCAYGLGGSGPSLSPYIDFLIPLRPSGYQHFIWSNIAPSLMGKLSPNQTVEGPAELRGLSSLTPFLGLCGLWKGLAPGDTSLLCHRSFALCSSWHGCTGQMRPQALGWHTVSCEPGLKLHPLHTICEQATSFSEAQFFILQMGIIMRPALRGFEVNWWILYWLLFE